MEFVLSIIILGITTLAVVALFPLTRMIETVLSWSLIAFAALVFVFQVANLFGKLNEIGFVLVIQTALLAAVLGLWLYKGRPGLLPEFRVKIDWRVFLKDKKNWPLLGLLGALTGALVLYVVLIYIVPPNNVDALSIHLARVLKWMQLGSYFPWGTRNVWQVSFPVNAQLTYLWTVLFTNTDHFIAYIPYIAGLLTALVVYLLSREIGFDGPSSVFAGAVWLAFPVVQLHLTSVRHDLVSTWLFVLCLYFFYRWGSSKQTIYMTLSALALGLVVGTNFSIAAYLPGLFVILLVSLVLRQQSWKEMLLFGGAALGAFLVFSSPVFISNTIHFGSPVGPDAAVMTSTAMTQELSLWQYLGVNITRWSYQFLDFSALPKPVSTFAIHAKAWGIEQMFSIGIHNMRCRKTRHGMAWSVYVWFSRRLWLPLFGVSRNAICC